MVPQDISGLPLGNGGKQSIRFGLCFCRVCGQGSHLCCVPLRLKGLFYRLCHAAGKWPRLLRVPYPLQPALTFCEINTGVGG